MRRRRRWRVETLLLVGGDGLNDADGAVGVAVLHLVGDPAEEGRVVAGGGGGALRQQAAEAPVEGRSGARRSQSVERRDRGRRRRGGGWRGAALAAVGRIQSGGEGLSCKSETFFHLIRDCG